MVSAMEKKAIAAVMARRGCNAIWANEFAATPRPRAAERNHVAVTRTRSGCEARRHGGHAAHPRRSAQNCAPKSRVLHPTRNRPAWGNSSLRTAGRGQNAFQQRSPEAPAGRAQHLQQSCAAPRIGQQLAARPALRHMRIEEFLPVGGRKCAVQRVGQHRLALCALQPSPGWLPAVLSPNCKTFGLPNCLLSATYTTCPSIRCNSLASSPRPRLMRLFTVPSGMRSTCAISL